MNNIKNGHLSQRVIGVLNIMIDGQECISCLKKGLGHLSLKMQNIEFNITVLPSQNVCQNLMSKILKF